MEMENWVQGLLQWRGFSNNNLCNRGYIFIDLLYKKGVELSALCNSRENFSFDKFIFALNLISVLKLEFPSQTEPVSPAV